MKKSWKYLGTAFIITLFSISLSAQKVWTLQECVGYALDNNIQIKRQTLQKSIAENNYTQSKIDLLPDLYAGGSHTMGRGKALNVDNYQYTNKVDEGNVGLQSTLVLFSGFQKLNTVKYQKFTLLTMQQNLEKAKNDISLNIASAYLQILFSKELLEVAKSQQQVTKLQVEKTSKLVEVGNVARGSLLDILAQEANEEANVVNAQNQLNLSYISLAQLLDLDTVKNFMIYIPDSLTVPSLFHENSDSIYLLALNNLPEIKSATYYFRGSQSQLAVARGAYLPQLSLTGNYSTRYSLRDSLLSDPMNPYSQRKTYPISDQLSDKMFRSVQLNLTIPLFTKYQNRTRVSNAKIGVQDAELALRQAKIQLRKEVEQAYADALAAYENYKSQQEAVNASEEAFKYIQQKFDVGLVNSVDYNISKNSYIKAKSDLLHAKYEFLFKTKILDFYKGNQITL